MTEPDTGSQNDGPTAEKAIVVDMAISTSAKAMG